MSELSVEIVFTGERLSMPELLELAVAAEGAGFGGLWMAEAYRSSTVSLAAIAERTSGPRVGSNVTQWTRGLPTLELECGDLAELSEGRFRLGLGTSTKEWNESWFGIAYERPLVRMREYVEALRLLWTAGPDRPVSFHGEFFDITDYLRFNGPLETPVPIHLAVTRTGMAKLAGEVADGVNFNCLLTPDYMREVTIPALEEGAARAGRSVSQLELGASPLTAVSDDADEAIEWCRHQVAFYCGITTYFEGVMRLHGFEDDYFAVRELFAKGDLPGAVARVPDHMVDTLTLAGTPEQIREKVQRYAGVCDFVMVSPPSFLLDKEAVLRNQRNIIAAFGEGERVVTDLAAAAKELDLPGCTALVAGGSKGIGLGTAQQLLERGAHVVVTGRGEDALREALDVLEPVAARVGTTAHAVAGDVGDEDDVRRAVETATAVQGKPPQVVVASAGNGWITRFLSLSAEEWDEIHRTHVRGSFLVVREAARALVTAGLPGSMVVITSLNADAATGGTAAYSAAKAAQTQFVRVTARELGRHQIRVNAVAPGITVTPMTDPYLEGAYRQAFIDGTPLTRLGEVADIADAICFLLSRQGRWVNGAAIPVDGGAHLQGLHDYADVLGRPAWPDEA